MNQRRFASALLASILIVCGLAQAALAAADPLRQARQEWQDGQLKHAVILLKDYLQSRPADAEARILMARIYLDLRQGRAAENELARARDAGAGRERLSELLAEALLLAGEPQRVLDEIVVVGAQPARAAALTAWQGEALRRLGQSREAGLAFERALALAPDQPTALLGLARIALAEGRFEDGRALIVRATEAAAMSPEPWELLAELDFARGDLAAAEASLIKAEIVARNKAVPRFKRALTRIEQGKLDAAEADIERVAAVFPGFAGLDFARGVLFLRRGQVEEGVAALTRFRKQDPGNLRASFLLGIAEMQRGNADLAEGYLLRYLDTLPDSVPAALALAQLRLSANDLFGAEAVLERFMDERDAPAPVFALMARVLAAQGHFDEARARIAEAIALAPDNADYRVSHADYLNQLGRADAAAAELDAAVEIDPLNRSAALLRIKDHLQRGRYAEALTLATRFADARRDDPFALNALGLARVGTGDLDGARAAFERALAARPGFADALLNLSRLALRDGDSGAARRLLEDVLAGEPDHTEAVLALGELDAANGDTSSQTERLQRAVEHQPGNLEFRVALARALLKRGEPARALAHLQAAPERLKRAPELLVLRGEAEIALGATDEAIETYQALRIELPSSAAGHYLLARAYARAGKPAAMTESLVRGVEIDPGNALAPATLNLVQETLGGVPEQLDLLERLLRASGDDPRLVARKADLYTEHGDHARAEALIQGLWQRHPGDPGVMRRLVAVQRAAGKVDDYTRLLEDWIEASPDDDPARLMLAEVYAEQQRDDDALALLGVLAESYPSNPIILNNLAWLLRDRDPEQALQYAEQAYRLSPEDPALLDTLGALLLGRGDSGRALRLLDAAHVADPNDPTIAYHYARALAAERRRGDARVVLLGLVDRPFPQQEAARQLLAELSD